MQLDNMGALEEFRVTDGLDVWVVPDFAQSVLGFDPAAVQAALEANYATKGAGDAIEAGTVQWVNGDNAALKYRGNELKRGKIWLQRLASADGYLRYGYTGWQWRVLPATADVARCPEVLPIADAYDEWATGLGFPHANHYIVTKYRDGQHNIGFHSDKPMDIAPGSLITVVKTGTHGRPFELCYPGEESAPFYSQVLAPGTAVIMTLEANLKTKHGVPIVAEAGASGSIVFRTIATKLTPETVVKELGKRKCLTVATDADPLRHTAPEVDPSTICDGSGVTEEGVGEEAKRTRKEVLELEKQEAKRARKAGAILAPSRTAEGYSLPPATRRPASPTRSSTASRRSALTLPPSPASAPSRSQSSASTRWRPGRPSPRLSPASTTPSRSRRRRGASRARAAHCSTCCVLHRVSSSSRSSSSWTACATSTASCCPPSRRSTPRLAS